MKELTYLIFTDLDGTLLDHHDYSFEPALPVLRELQKQGHVIIPNTSKTFAELNQFCQKIPLNSPFIVENGAAVYIPQGFLPKQPVGTTLDHELWCKRMTEPRAHWLSLLALHTADFREEYYGFSDMTVEEIVQHTSLDVFDARLASQREFSEPLLWLSSQKRLDEFTTIMEQEGATILQGGRFVHVSGQCDKGTALTWLTEQFSICYPNRVFKTVALGDSGNDSAMLEAADIAIQIKAPERAFPVIQKKENLYQSTLCGPEGWAETLSSLIIQPSRGGN